MTDFTFDSVLSLLKEWKVEGVDPKKHAADGNIDAYSFDLASVFLSLFVYKTHEVVITHVPETIGIVANEMKKLKIVRLTPDNHCEMVEPSVADHFEFISTVVALDALNKINIAGLRSLVWQVLCVLYKVLSNETASSENVKFVLPPLDPLIWTPKNKEECLIKPSHRLVTFKTKFGYVSSGSPIESNLFTQGDPKFVPVAYLLPAPVFQKPCGCELEYPTFFCDDKPPHPLAFIGSSDQLKNLESLLVESLLGPDKEHWDPEDWASTSTIAVSPTSPSCPRAANSETPMCEANFTAERQAIVPETWPSYSLENLHSSYTMNSFSEDNSVEIELPVREGPNCEATSVTGKLRVKNNNGFYTVYEDGELVLAFDGEFQHLKRGKLRKPLLCKSLASVQTSVPSDWKPPMFGVTFFANCRCCVSCCRTVTLIIWVNGKGILVDPCNGCLNSLSSSSILPMISGIIVTHCHKDTLGGVLPFLQSKATERLPVLTTRTIFESLRRQIFGFAPLPSTADFRPIHVREPFFFDGCSMTFCYSMHSIPALSFQIEFSSKKICYLGSSLYHPSLFNRMRREGTMTVQRESELLHFGADSDLIICGVGLAPFHTKISKLSSTPYNLRSKIVTVNLSPGQEYPEMLTTSVRSAEYGFPHTIAIELGSFNQGYARGIEVVSLLANAPYLCNLSAPDIATIMGAMTEQRYGEGVVVVNPLTSTSTEAKHKHVVYLIESGTAELFNADKALSFPFNVPMSELGRGDLFADTDGILCKVVAKTPINVFAIPEKVLASCCNGLTSGLHATSSSSNSSSMNGGNLRNCNTGSDVLRALRFRSFLIQTFSQSSMFRSLNHEHISVLASCVSDEVQLSVNDRLIKQGDTADRSLYIIREGTLGIFVSRADLPRPTEMARVGPGSCVGEMALLQGKPRSADVIAMTPACVLRIKQEEMDLVMQKYPQIRFILDSVIRSRIDGIVEPVQFRAPRPRPVVNISSIPRCINADNRPPPVFLVPVSPHSPRSPATPTHK